MKRVWRRKMFLLPLFAVAILAVALMAPHNVGIATATVDVEQATIIAGRTITEAELATIGEALDTAATAASLGTAGEMQTSREIILYKNYGDDAMAVYNFAENAAYTVSGSFYAQYVADDHFRRLGAPTTEQGTFTLSGRSTANPITEGSYTAQLFETGLLIQGEAEVYMYVGAVEKRVSQDTTAYVLHPVIDDQDIMRRDGEGMVYFGNMDGEMHPLKDADIIRMANGSYRLFVNYRSACVRVDYDSDYNITEQYIYAARNYFMLPSGRATAILPSACVSAQQMVSDGSSPVDDNALDYYRDAHSNGTADSLVQLFADCYEDLMAEGYSAGYRCSRIKMWDLLVLDMRYGDGTTGFDEAGSGARERMTCLVYNPDQDCVYPVNNAYFIIFKSDEGVGRRTLGYPESRVLYDQVIGGVAFDEIQIFRNGYIYKTPGGRYLGVTGYHYDSEENTFIPPTTVPDVPDRYGEFEDSRTEGTTVYMNYERGAILAELTLNGSKYRYTYYHGRNFDFSASGYPVSLLPMSELFSLDDLVPKGAMPTTANRTPIDFYQTIQPLLYAKYTALYEAGYFCGFVEEEFKGSWNGVFAQQFVVGDSTSMIFGEERPNVSALVYNRRTGQVYLMRDDVIRVWQHGGNYNTAGSPTSDEYRVEGCDYYFQTFDFGMTIRDGNYIVFTEEYTDPQEYVAARADNPLPVPTHGRDQATGYIG